MIGDLKPNLDEYASWSKNNLDVDFGSKKTKEIYEDNQVLIKAAIDNVLKKRIKAFIESCDKQYLRKRKCDLLMSSSEYFINWHDKPYMSAVNKSYRYNVIENPAWPNEHPDRWMKPENWFYKMNDTIRTRITCKYIDGPVFLAEKLDSLMKDLNLDYKFSSRQKDDGYYAYHCYISIPTNLITETSYEKDKHVDVEIQITTQLQAALNDITHLYYEDIRIQRDKDVSTWKWEFKTSRFQIGYLSHTLHLLEAMIAEVRDKSFKSRKK
jgi:hypothetical protein